LNGRFHEWTLFISSKSMPNLLDATLRKPLRKKESPSATPVMYRTSDLAREVGTHPNTVRMYEQWGFLPSPPRGKNGYRAYSRMHLEQYRLARLAMHGGWPGAAIRKSALALVRTAAAGNLREALALARRHLRLVREEQAAAERAVYFVDCWVRGKMDTKISAPFSIQSAARYIGVSQDVLRNWERDGLIRVPRDARNHYRVYASAEMQRMRVIHALRRAGYSTMAVLRMLSAFDRGQRTRLRKVLDTPPAGEDMIFATDQWLTTLAEQEQRAKKILAQVRVLLRLASSPLETLH
jgi:DNA-binding transcriptional MerR regulator